MILISTLFLVGMSSIEVFTDYFDQLLLPQVPTDSTEIYSVDLTNVLSPFDI
jgi:hypothetical protein